MKSKIMATLKILLIIALVIMTVMIFMPKNHTEETIVAQEHIDKKQNEISFMLVEDIIRDDIRDSIEWNTFMLAVAMEESRWNANAENGNAVGFLQITPICVKECNRILGRDTFSLEDRWSQKHSVEMWNVIQNHHNPTHDHDKALEIWNPNHSEQYAMNIQYHYDTMFSEF